MHPDDTAECFRAHLGLWAIQPLWMQQAVDAIAQGLWPLREFRSFQSFDQSEERQAATPERDRLWMPAGNGVAVIRMVGGITKGISKFGGASTILTRRALRQAVADEDVESILLAIDSPGGQVAGVAELAAEVRKTQDKKPVTAYIEDLGASAAYWIASQAQRITANATAEIGSIGVFAVLHDISGLAAREGVRVVVKSTGPYKGAGVPGTVISQDVEDDVQRHVDGIGTFFFDAVREGRRLSAQKLEAVTDGRTWLAAQAQDLGLIDGVESFDDAVIMTARMRPRRRMAAEQRQAQLHAEKQAQWRLEQEKELCQAL